MPKQKPQMGKTARLDANAHKIIEDIKGVLVNEGYRKPDTSDAIRKLATGNRLANELCALLWRYAGEKGDNEGAVDVLQRLIDEHRQ